MEELSAVIDHAAALPVDRRLAAARILQRMLVDLIDLSLQGKQAHWNLRGRSFRDLHLQLDEIVGQSRELGDRVAERCLALGVAADGRLETVAGDTHLDPFPEGRIEDTDVVEAMVTRLQVVSEAGRSRLGELGDLDPVSQDVVIEVLEAVEKQLWMMEAHRAPAGR
jgi:starvation-inducible DNA-binding protein